MTDKNDSYEKIISAATVIFAEKGYERASIRIISQKAKVNISLVSYHFGGKKKLYHKIIERHISDFNKAIKTQLEDRDLIAPMTQELFVQKIKSIAEVFFRMRFESEHVCKMLLREKCDYFPHSRKIFESLMTPMVDDMKRFFKAAVESKIISPDIEASVYFTSLFETMMGYSTMQACQLKPLYDLYELPKDKEKFLNFIAKIYVKGVLA